jgi:2-polyprenyl-3-methyl-5-hydroxy-6-metoxy-1,4-benzoquinol methylase
MMTWEQAVLQLRNDPAQAELVRACFYDDPLAEAAVRYSKSSEWHALEKLLPARKGKALDLGAGRGIVAYALASHGWRVAAAEPDSSGIVGANAIRFLAPSMGVNIDVVEAAGEALPFDSNSFDLVHCRAVLHHATDLTQLCREIARVLSPGGALVATREPVLSHESDLEIFLRHHPLHRMFGGEHAYMLPIYIAAITGAGLQMERVLNPFESDINLFPGTLIGLKKSIARRLMLPDHRFVPDWCLRWLGHWNKTPGRLYTFVARKPRRHKGIS